MGGGEGPGGEESQELDVPPTVPVDPAEPVKADLEDRNPGAPAGRAEACLSCHVAVGGNSTGERACSPLALTSAQQHPSNLQDRFSTAALCATRQQVPQQGWD